MLDASRSSEIRGTGWTLWSSAQRNDHLLQRTVCVCVCVCVWCVVCGVCGVWCVVCCGCLWLLVFQFKPIKLIYLHTVPPPPRVYHVAMGTH